MSGGDPAALLASGALAALSEAARHRLGDSCDELHLDAGEELAREGSPADAMYVVVRGGVVLSLHERGREMTVASLGPGDLVGWSWFVEPHVWAFDVAAGDPTDLVRIPADDLRSLVAQDPVAGQVVAEALVRALGRRLRDTRVQLLDLYAGESP